MVYDHSFVQCRNLDASFSAAGGEAGGFDGLCPQNVDFPLFAVFCGFAVEHLWLTVIRGDGETQFSAFYGMGRYEAYLYGQAVFPEVSVFVFHCSTLTQVDGFPGMSQTVDDGMLTCHGIMFRAVPQL